jgi:hypothetical protein
VPRTLPRGTTLALLIAVTLSLSACGGAASSDLTDLVEPLVTPSEDLLEPLGDPGVGTITMTQESHGSYTSPRGNPVQVDRSDQATITFELVTDEAETFTTSSGTVTWTYSLESVETGDECTVRESGEGGGTFETGPNGPTVTLGMTDDFQLDSNAYLLSVAGSPEDPKDDDPSQNYRVASSICGGDMPLDEDGGGAWWPYLVGPSLVSGQLTEGSTRLSGTHQETVPSLNADAPPIEVTITWEIRLP